MCSNYNLQSGNVSIAVGGKYTLDDGSVLKVSRVGISWGFKLPTTTKSLSRHNSHLIVVVCMHTLFTEFFKQAKVNNNGQVGLSYAQDIR